MPGERYQSTVIVRSRISRIIRFLRGRCTIGGLGSVRLVARHQPRVVVPLRWRFQHVGSWPRHWSGPRVDRSTTWPRPIVWTINIGLRVIPMLTGLCDLTVIGPNRDRWCESAFECSRKTSGFKTFAIGKRHALFTLRGDKCVPIGFRYRYFCTSVTFFTSGFKERGANGAFLPVRMILWTGVVTNWRSADTFSTDPVMVAWL